MIELLPGCHKSQVQQLIMQGSFITVSECTGVVAIQVVTEQGQMPGEKTAYRVEAICRMLSKCGTARYVWQLHYHKPACKSHVSGSRE